MKCYVYVDLDGKLGLRTYKYIMEDNPGFFSQNQGYILKHWKIDTDDNSSLWRFLKYCQDYGIQISVLNNFITQLGLTQEKLREVARNNVAK